MALIWQYHIYSTVKAERCHSFLPPLRTSDAIQYLD